MSYSSTQRKETNTWGQTFEPSWLASLPIGSKRVVEGVVDYLIYESSFGDYQVYSISTNEGSIQISGDIGVLAEGFLYEFHGVVSLYRQSHQLKVSQLNLIEPTGRLGVVRYLQTLPGLNLRAEALYDKYQEDTIPMLLNAPEKVAKQMAGIGVKSTLRWQEVLQEKEKERAEYIHLFALGLTNQQIEKAKKYTETTELLQAIKNNPYLLKNCCRFTFAECDEIALQVGHDMNSWVRWTEGLIALLEKGQSNGHTYVPLSVMEEQAKDLFTHYVSDQDMDTMYDWFLQNDTERTYRHSVQNTTYDINKEIFMDSYTNWKMSGSKKERYQLVSLDVPMLLTFLQTESKKEDYPIFEVDKAVLGLDESGFALSDLTKRELMIATMAVMLQEGRRAFVHGQSHLDLMDTHLKARNIELEVAQKRAVELFNETKGGLHLLVGIAGGGKTFTLKIILDLLEKQYALEKKEPRIVLCAPTGKAAKVVRQSTGRNCQTIHKLLMVQRDGTFHYDQTNPLPADVVVVDEASMLDIPLAYALLTALKRGAKLILMGDTKQLPSVGCGNVLLDLIQSHETLGVELVELTVPKRQQEAGNLFSNCQAITQGEMIDLSNTHDTCMIERPNNASIVKTTLHAVQRLLTRPNVTLEDIQVLTPMKGGALGVHALNYHLQQAFNPHATETNTKRAFSRKLTLENSKEEWMYFYLGDKVIHTRNIWDMPIFKKDNMGNLAKIKDEGVANGEVGVIVDIYPTVVEGMKTMELVVLYDFGYVKYNDFDVLEHAYAMSIHKSQGSQWKYVILPFSMNQQVMLENNLLYTGYSRTKEMVCVIGQSKAIAYAINTHKAKYRYTLLQKYVSMFQMNYQQALTSMQ